MLIIKHDSSYGVQRCGALLLPLPLLQRLQLPAIAATISVFCCRTAIAAFDTALPAPTCFCYHYFVDLFWSCFSGKHTQSNADCCMSFQKIHLSWAYEALAEGRQKQPSLSVAGEVGMALVCPRTLNPVERAFQAAPVDDDG